MASRSVQSKRIICTVNEARPIARAKTPLDAGVVPSGFPHLRPGPRSTKNGAKSLYTTLIIITPDRTNAAVDLRRVVRVLLLPLGLGTLSYAFYRTSSTFIVCIRRRALFRDENNNFVHH